MLIVKQICPRSSQMLRDNFNECSTSLKWNKDRVRELETKLTSLQEELHLTKEAASANEEQLSAELSTVNKLVKLYKESSKEWSQKAGDLDGVIKALETHLGQVQNDYKERLEREVSARQQFERANYACFLTPRCVCINKFLVFWNMPTFFLPQKDFN